MVADIRQLDGRVLAHLRYSLLPGEVPLQGVRILGSRIHTSAGRGTTGWEPGRVRTFQSAAFVGGQHKRNVVVESVPRRRNAVALIEHAESGADGHVPVPLRIPRQTNTGSEHLVLL